MRRLFLVMLAVVVASALPSCGGDPATVRLLLAGDVSLGRSITNTALVHPQRLFPGLSVVASAADLAMVNLESPLTNRPHIALNPIDLSAPPEAAAVLADSGIRLVGIANNHTGDAGPGAVLDTVAAAKAAGLDTVGAGADLEAAMRPEILDLGGVEVGVLAFDATNLAPPAAAESAGVASWDEHVAEVAVRALRSRVDLVVVSIHGGVEYIPFPDVTLTTIAGVLASWNVDVVWGHGAHVIHPVELVDPDRDGRPTLVATGLGNLLFDQSYPGTDHGALLEVIGSRRGVTAYRLGLARSADGAFESWVEPQGPAVWIDGWWEAPDSDPDRRPAPDLSGFDLGDVVAGATGDIDGDGETELVVSFRRRYRPADLHDLFPHRQWMDRSGRTAHIGVFDAETLEPEWVAGAMLRPVADLEVCGGALAVAYDRLDVGVVEATGAWAWSGFGFDEGPDLEGTRAIGCLDVDGDGTSEPWVGVRQVDGL